MQAGVDANVEVLHTRAEAPKCVVNGPRLSTLLVFFSHCYGIHKYAVMTKRQFGWLGQNLHGHLVADR